MALQTSNLQGYCTCDRNSRVTVIPRRWQDRLTYDEPLSLFEASRLAQALTKSF